MNEEILQELQDAVLVLKRIESRLETANAMLEVINTQLTIMDSSADLSSISTYLSGIESMLQDQAMARALEQS